MLKISESIYVIINSPKRDLLAGLAGRVGNAGLAKHAQPRLPLASPKGGQQDGHEGCVQVEKSNNKNLA